MGMGRGWGGGSWVIRSFIFANWHLVKLGSSPFREMEILGSYLP